MSAQRQPFGQLFGIWCYDANNHTGDWMRNSPDVAEDAGIVAFSTVRRAQRAARRSYGYNTYPEAKKDGWVAVLPLTKA